MGRERAVDGRSKTGYVCGTARSRHHTVLGDAARPKMPPSPPVGAAHITWRGLRFPSLLLSVIYRGPPSPPVGAAHITWRGLRFPSLLLSVIYRGPRGRGRGPGPHLCLLLYYLTHNSCHTEHTHSYPTRVRGCDGTGRPARPTATASKLRRQQRKPCTAVRLEKRPTVLARRGAS